MQEAPKKEDQTFQRYNLTSHNLDKFNSQFQSMVETKPQEAEKEAQSIFMKECIFEDEE